MKADGMTYRQISYNIYAFGADATRFRRKAERARKNHTRAKWESKMRGALKLAANNERRRDNLIAAIEENFS